jgi:5,10-methylenetetrahydrofolate reductase
MASEFIGLQMLVTVRGDPPRRLKGTVSAVEAGAGLTLSNGEFRLGVAHYCVCRLIRRQ